MQSQHHHSFDGLKIIFTPMFSWVFILHFCFLFTENLTPFGNATQSSTFSANSKAEYAVNQPISNKFDLNGPYCSHTKTYPSNSNAWWMFNFSFKTAYITDITIYYRKECK